MATRFQIQMKGTVNMYTNIKDSFLLLKSSQIKIGFLRQKIDICGEYIMYGK